MTAPVRWPGGRRFAFSIFDDTDWMTVENGRPVYDLLSDSGIRITKSVWPLGPERPQTVGGASCADAEYLDWVRDLQDRGHEIGYHHASDHSSERSRTIEALDRFKVVFGHDPRVGADHAGNRESIAGGAGRLTGWRGAVYRRVERIRQPDRPTFSGDVPGSPWFWGDVCRERIQYWRSLTFAATDLSRICPIQPFHDPRRPYVNYWFVSADAPRLRDLLARLAAPQLDRLEASGGFCILYTHLGLDAAPGGRVDPRLVRAVADLADRDGWFVPVSDVLDHLLSDRAAHVITDRQRARLERRWIVDRLLEGTPVGPTRQTHDEARR